MTFADAIAGISARARAWPRLPPHPIALPRAARQVERRFSQSRTISAGGAEVLLQRIRSEDPANLSAMDLRHALEPAWQRWQADADHADWLRGLTRAALAFNRRSVDRRLVGAWIQLFPQGPLAGELASAAREAAERHDWPYRSAGQRFHLWDPEEGPATLGLALLEAAAPADVLREAAIGPVQVGAGLVQAALARASDVVAETAGAGATAACTALLNLIDQMGPEAILSETRAWMVRGLLRPWRHSTPPMELKARIQKHLVAAVGDPRLGQTRWLGIERAWRDAGKSEDADTLRLILKRWLVSASFETFFRIMGRTTGDPGQWQARERFWRKYLEGGHVHEAWFILGHEAERQVRAYRDELAEAGGYGRVDKGATSSHSALLMQIGDIVIAEWTHNGSCCFWQRNAVRRPALYEMRYDGHYMRNSERMRRAAARQASELGSKPLWEAHTHHDGWETRFADVIRRLTGIRV
jgi:hypothetical protein